MSYRRNLNSGHYWVICRHRGSDAPRRAWHPVTVVIGNVDCAQEAAANACLYLIWDRQGEAEALAIIGSLWLPVSVDGGIFDANEFAETITFRGKILSATA